MLRTRLYELLEIEAPVLGAPMGPDIAGLDVAAAVSNAGGLGMISWGGYAPPALRERIRKLRTMTSKPFGVNILLDGPHLPLPESAYVDACIAERVPVLSFFWKVRIFRFLNQPMWTPASRSVFQYSRFSGAIQRYTWVSAS